MAAETSQTLDRGIRVLRLLAESPEGITVTDLAVRLDVNRTVAYRLVATLEQHGLVRRNDNGLLHLGMGVLTLAGAVQPLLRDRAVPILRQLAETVGCTAHLTIADGDEAVALVVVEPSWTEYHVAYRVGSRHPVAQGAAGKAICILREGDQHTPYAVTTGELASGAHGLAAPVRGVAGLEASVGIVTLGGPLDESVVAPRVLRAADEVALRLR
ncbi:IclR family transcriptional regulator [Nocardioides daphniae]|uniref:Transcriptional regulator n=1 Tax=Nocardioides daphniae TaxID=402297 RepID=A0A4P7UBQ4_9ACTN|nr:helix-turn-helix domain-containing protein [Nocardioides daphniae]QCC76745.1 MarR family transcriptional regulator [Nocardioides daphniae]GGD15930.1 transcriptional regulator [Nocardioides daphniae]